MAKTIINDTNLEITDFKINKQNELEELQINGNEVSLGEDVNLQDKEVQITSNGTTTVEPDSGYDGMSSVELSVNVPIQTTKEVTITTNSTTTIEPDEGYAALESVEVTTNVPTDAKTLFGWQGMYFTVEKTLYFICYTTEASNITSSTNIYFSNPSQGSYAYFQIGKNGSVFQFVSYDATNNRITMDVTYDGETYSGIVFSRASTADKIID